MQPVMLGWGVPVSVRFRLGPSGQPVERHRKAKDVTCLLRNLSKGFTCAL